MEAIKPPKKEKTREKSPDKKKSPPPPGRKLEVQAAEEHAAEQAQPVIAKVKDLLEQNRERKREKVEGKKDQGKDRAAEVRSKPEKNKGEDANQ